MVQGGGELGVGKGARKGLEANQREAEAVRSILRVAPQLGAELWREAGRFRNTVVWDTGLKVVARWDRSKKAS